MCGLTENAGPEFDGHEIDGPSDQAWNWQTWNWWARYISFETRL